MKINVLTSPFWKIPPEGSGAVERLWYQLSMEFARKGHQVNLYGRILDNRKQRNDKNFLIHAQKGFSFTRFMWINLLYDFIYSFQALLKMERADVLVMNSFWSPFLVRFFTRKSKLKIYNVQRMPKGQFFLYGCVDLFICPSSAVKSKLLCESLNIESKLLVIGNPIATEIFLPRHFENKSELKQVVYFGRINEEKGLDILVKAISELRSEYSIALTLIGPSSIHLGGSGKDYVERLKSILGDNLTLIDPIKDSRELYHEIIKYDFFCYPSLAVNGETFGVSVLEAMSAGIPIVASELECFKDFLEHNKNGLMFNHESDDIVQELKMCLVKYITDEALITNCTKEGLKKALEYDVSKIAELHLKVYEENLSKIG